MQTLANYLVVHLFGADPATWPWTQVVYAVVMGLIGFALVNFGAITAGIFSWAERRIAARMQSRVGPNRNGPAGFLQWIADAVKLMLKEDLIPGESDHILFRVAPYFVMVGFSCTFVVLPFARHLVATNMDLGLFYVISITALVVVGILVSGWASNSKWSLFGAMRAAAQIVSYEIPGGVALMVPVLITGTLSMQEMIRLQSGIQGNFFTQGGWPWNWNLFHDPAAFACFFIYFTAALAEGNRAPFDLAEAESEIVAGYNTEYSGFRFSVFFLVEWGNVWVMSAIACTAFLGGWGIPGVSNATLDHASGAAAVGLELATLFLFAFKTLSLCFVVIWLRWTLPRIRVDQMMTLCWKYLVPASFAAVVFETVWTLAFARSPGVQLALGVVFFVVAGAIPLWLFAKRTYDNIGATGDVVDLSNW